MRTDKAFCFSQLRAAIRNCNTQGMFATSSDFPYYKKQKSILSEYSLSGKHFFFFLIISEVSFRLVISCIVLFSLISPIINDNFNFKNIQKSQDLRS